MFAMLNPFDVNIPNAICGFGHAAAAAGRIAAAAVAAAAAAAAAAVVTDVPAHSPPSRPSFVGPAAAIAGN